MLKAQMEVLESRENAMALALLALIAVAAVKLLKRLLGR